MLLRILTIFLAVVACGCSAPFYKEAPEEPRYVHSVGSVPNGRNKLATREFAESASMGHWAGFAKQESETLQKLFVKGKAGSPSLSISAVFLGSDDLLRKVCDPRTLGAKTILFGYDEGRCYALVKISLDAFLKAWKDAALSLGKTEEKVALKIDLDKTITLYKSRKPYKMGVTLPRGKFSRRQRRVQ